MAVTLVLAALRAYTVHRWCSWTARRGYAGRRAWMGAHAWPVRPDVDPHTGRPNLTDTVTGWWRTDIGLTT